MWEKWQTLAEQASLASQWQQAEEYGLKAIDAATSEGNKYKLAQTLPMLAKMYAESGNIVKAAEFIPRGIRMLEEVFGPQSALLGEDLEFFASFAQHALHDWQTATRLRLRAITIWELRADKKRLLDSLDDAIEMFAEFKDSENARLHATRAVEVRTELFGKDASEVIEAMEMYNDIFAESGLEPPFVVPPSLLTQPSFG